jgi:predicted NUDIX family NTP pyrophosphohydrolase
MPVRSAGILLYRRRCSAIEVFLVHPGGPLWNNKDSGAWSIPKGLIGGNEDALLGRGENSRKRQNLIWTATSGFSVPSGNQAANT